MPDATPGSAALADRLLEKGLPQSPETERLLLGAILLNRHLFYTVADQLKPEDFSRPGHSRIYEAMMELVRDQVEIDPVTLVERLEKRGWLTEAGGAAYVGGLATDLPRQAAAESYGRFIKEKASLRRLISTAQDIIVQCYSDDKEPRDVINEAERAIFSIAEDQLEGKLRSLLDVDQRHADVFARLQEHQGVVTGLSTGFDRLDRMTAGLHPGELIIVAGRPGMGKTSFAVNIGLYAARKRQTVAVFSLEMSEDQLHHRLICQVANPGINFSKFRSGALTPAEWVQVTHARGVLSGLNMFIDETPGATVMDIRAKLRRLRAEQKSLDLVIIDYLQLMSGMGRAENRNLEIGAITRGLKNLAKELQVPIICLSQLSRAPESRGGPQKLEGHKPQLADLRESGNIEQDADVVMFLFRPFVYSRKDEDDGKATLILAKQRNGPTGDIPLTFIASQTAFKNPAEDAYEDEPWSGAEI